MRFVLLKNVSFRGKKFVGSGPDSKVEDTTTVIPEKSRLTAVQHTPISFYFKFSNGYEITTTLERFQELIAYGYIEEIQN